jgi:hypothetical protein
MKDNGHNSSVTVVAPAPNRIRASGPILVLAILFVIASFLTWYLTWFGRGLSDSEITRYLSDYSHPRHVQHALLQVQERIVRGDKTATQWYPQIVTLAGNPETEFRLTAAWVMGSDNTSDAFHNALKSLLTDREPIVRRNAALALVRFDDASGRAELLTILAPFVIKAPVAGTLESSLARGSSVSRGTMLARIRPADNQLVAMRSPLTGSIDELSAPDGSFVAIDQPLLTIKSDEESVWESLRALAMVGSAEDLKLIDEYANGSRTTNDRIKQQAALTAKAIRSRLDNGEKLVKP